MKISQDFVELLDTALGGSNQQLSAALGEKHPQPFTCFKDTLDEHDIAFFYDDAPNHEVGVKQCGSRHAPKLPQAGLAC